MGFRIRSDYYMKKYRIVPGIKAGMHAGKVVVMWVCEILMRGKEKKVLLFRLKEL
jgi:hypothetical protein